MLSRARSSPQRNATTSPAGSVDRVKDFSPRPSKDIIPDVAWNLQNLERLSKVVPSNREHWPPLDRGKLGLHLRVSSAIVTPSILNLELLTNKVLRPLGVIGAYELFDDDGYCICFQDSISEHLKAARAGSLLEEISGKPEYFEVFYNDVRKSTSNVNEKRMPNTDDGLSGSRLHTSQTSSDESREQSVQRPTLSSIAIISQGSGQANANLMTPAGHLATTQLELGSPTSRTEIPTAPTLNEDSASVMSAAITSDRSSTASGRGRRCCGICKKHSPLDATTLGHCSTCGRYFHRGCDGSKSFTTNESWRCNSCDTKQRDFPFRISGTASRPTSSHSTVQSPVVGKAIGSSPGLLPHATRATNETNTIPIAPGSTQPPLYSPGGTNETQNSPDPVSSTQAQIDHKRRRLPWLAAETSLRSEDKVPSEKDRPEFGRHRPVASLLVKLRYHHERPRDTHGMFAGLSSTLPRNSVVAKTSAARFPPSGQGLAANRLTDPSGPSHQGSKSGTSALSRDRVDSASSVPQPSGNTLQATARHDQSARLSYEGIQSVSGDSSNLPVGTRERPPYSYKQLIDMALQQAPGHRLQAYGIIQWVSDNVPGYDKRRSDLKSGISNGLSVKLHHPKGNLRAVERKAGDLGSGQWYEIIPGCEERLPRWDPIRRRMIELDSSQAGTAAKRRRTNTPMSRRDGMHSAAQESSAKRRKIARSSNLDAGDRSLAFWNTWEDPESYSGRFFQAWIEEARAADKRDAQDALKNLTDTSTAPSAANGVGKGHVTPSPIFTGNRDMYHELTPQSSRRSEQPVQLVVEHPFPRLYQRHTHSMLELSANQTVADLLPQTDWQTEKDVTPETGQELQDSGMPRTATSSPPQLPSLTAKELEGSATMDNDAGATTCPPLTAQQHKESQSLQSGTVSRPHQLFIATEKSGTYVVGQAPAEMIDSWTRTQERAEGRYQQGQPRDIPRSPVAAETTDSEGSQERAEWQRQQEEPPATQRLPATAQASDNGRTQERAEGQQQQLRATHSTAAVDRIDKERTQEIAQSQQQRPRATVASLENREIQETQFDLEVDYSLAIDALTSVPSRQVSEQPDLQTNLARAIEKFNTHTYAWSSPIKMLPKTKGVSLAEIACRPNRKEMVRRGRNYSRLGHNIALQRVNAIREGLERHIISEAELGDGAGGDDVEEDNDYGVADIDFDSSQPEQFKCLEDLVEMPRSIVPILYEGQLVFTDETKNARGRSGRAKRIYRIGAAAKGK